MPHTEPTCGKSRWEGSATILDYEALSFIHPERSDGAHSGYCHTRLTSRQHETKVCISRLIAQL